VNTQNKNQMPLNQAKMQSNVATNEHCPAKTQTSFARALPIETNSSIMGGCPNILGRVCMASGCAIIILRAVYKISLDQS